MRHSDLPRISFGIIIITNDLDLTVGYPDIVDIEGRWYRDGLPVTTSDYRTRMDQHSASLMIEEAFGDDSGVFTFRLKTPFGEAETSGSLVVTETHKSLSSVDEEMITPVKRRRPQQAPLTFQTLEEETGEAPRFIRYFLLIESRRKLKLYLIRT